MNKYLALALLIVACAAHLTTQAAINSVGQYVNTKYCPTPATF